MEKARADLLKSEIKIPADQFGYDQDVDSLILVSQQIWTPLTTRRFEPSGVCGVWFKSASRYDPLLQIWTPDGSKSEMTSNSTCLTTGRLKALQKHLYTVF